ncbi:hypothetical protein GBA52_025471 [Prunus armeniaca]|nr:hypothetical protein GBA52_025471 [Prunus armeniaca]
MISLADVYHVVAATVPLYVAMILAYVSVKWWKLFTPDQCSGINKFVAKFSIPLLSFQVISGNNPYKMNLKLILSDCLQKLIAFLALTAITKFSSHGGLNSIITGLSLSTMPNTLILGIPLLKAMAAKAASVTPSSESTAEEMEAPQEAQSKEEAEDETRSRTPKKIKSILLTVGRKLITNPNTHATLLGLIWASIHYKWGVKLPDIVTQSIAILSNGGLGMAMFSLGLFMASRGSIIACGTRTGMLAMGLKFIAGPALMAVSSFAVGLRGRILRVAIVQAALPQGIVPFVFSKEYNVHPDILSTGVIFGMLIALPIALAYYFLLGL